MADQKQGKNFYIRDNQHRGKVAEFLTKRIGEGSLLSFVSAYFTINAYDALEKHLNQIDRIRFLFGAPTFISTLDPEKTQQRHFRIDDSHLELENPLEQKATARRCAEWIRNKADIRSVRSAHLLHGKLYHIENPAASHAIVGSSNLTLRGLGLSKLSNIELNLIVDNDRDRTELKSWFDELWRDEELVEDVKGNVLDYLKQLYIDHPPEFIYFKTLFHIFEKFLEKDDDFRLFDQVRLEDHKIWKTLYKFQEDGARAAIHKINTYGGCILADSVGLGKTFTALAVIKYFELRNYRVLVLCPKKLRENWTVHRATNHADQNRFREDRFAYEVLSHTDLPREAGMVGDTNLETINWSKFDLVVIDESHNFKNHSSQRYEKLLEKVIKTGVTTKVLLLSATPVNNNLKDLRNQLYLITEEKDDRFADSMGISSLQDLLATAQKDFLEWSRKPRDWRGELADYMPSEFFTLLDRISIARSRAHIKDRYASSLIKLGDFPKHLKPLSIKPDIDLQREFPSYDRLNEILGSYKLSLFNPTAYLLEEFREEHDPGRKVKHFTQSDREHHLVGMMKIMFLKRLESSVHSFKVTMGRTVDKIKKLEKQISRYEAKHGSDTDLQSVDFLDSDEEDEDLSQAFEMGKKLKIPFEHLNLNRLKDDLKADRQHLEQMAEAAEKVKPERDEKLAELRNLIKDKIGRPEDQNRKVIVFCAYADTANYLYKNLEETAKNLNVHIALVTGSNKLPNKTTFGESDYNHILINFSPIAREREKIESMQKEDEEIDILIATDCISEGQNLQDCALLVNYDIHWNPVRIIQRFGRIDRLGSRHKEIQMVNFWPTKDLDKYLNLEKRVKAKMALVDLTATAQGDLLNPEEVEESVKQEMSYRDRQLRLLEDEIPDLDDIGESISLNDFTLDDFRMDLLEYLEANRGSLENAPMGLYGIVARPTDAEQDHPIQPGVIFCLKQVEEATRNEAINPLQPYYLVYIYDDGKVRCNFTAPKKILDVFRHLCRGESEANRKLCELFNQRTESGESMEHYDGLLEKAVDAICVKFQDRNIRGFFAKGRKGILVDTSDHVADISDFELITWLVIMNGDSADAQA